MVSKYFYHFPMKDRIPILFICLNLNKRQRKLKGQSGMDNPEETEGAIRNGQSREN